MMAFNPNRSSAIIDGHAELPNASMEYEVDIHNQRCPGCGAIGSIMGGACQSCGARCRLVDGASSMPNKKGNVKTIKPKALMTAKDVMDDPMDNFREEDDDGIVFEEPEEMDEEKYAISMIKQLKGTLSSHVTLLGKYFTRITIEIEPEFKFKVARKPKEIEF